MIKIKENVLFLIFLIALFYAHGKINTSIKLPLTISVNSKSVNKIQNFEDVLSKMDLVSNYNILKFDSNNIYFKIIYNGSPKKFLQEMIKNKINIETQGQIWRVR